MQLGERCRIASDAHDAAGRALDFAMTRDSGATAAEWKADHDTRVDLRVARAAYVRESLAFAATSSAIWHLVKRA